MLDEDYFAGLGSYPGGQRGWMRAMTPLKSCFHAAQKSDLHVDDEHQRPAVQWPLAVQQLQRRFVHAGITAAMMRPPLWAGLPSQVVTTPPAPVMIGIRAAMS